MPTIRRALLALASLAVLAGAAQAQPNLRPIPSRIEHGVVSVQNNGDAISGRTLVTINCHVPGARGGCPEAAGMAAFTHPAYPNRLVVRIPRIAPGHVYNFNLPFWGALAFAPGSYQFDFVVDPGNLVAESNEGDNSGSHVMTTP